MELIYAPFACSLAAHIACLEAGLPVTLIRVDLATKDFENGGSLWTVNPKGQVPTLRLDDGGVLTEGAAVLQYIADRKPESGLAPPHGSMDRYRLVAWLNFIATELHKRVFYPVFAPDMPAAAKQEARAAAPAKLAILERQLAGRPAGRPFLVGDCFSVADAYLFWWLQLLPRAGIETGNRPAVLGFIAACRARPGVQLALARETAAWQHRPAPVAAGCDAGAAA